MSDVVVCPRLGSSATGAVDGGPAWMSYTRQHSTPPAASVGLMNNHPRYLAIDPERLHAMRQLEADEFGNPWKPHVAEGWEPLRCCLRKAAEGDDIALISYSPWTLPWTTPWSEAGPVFVCFHRCPGYPTTGRYPPELRTQQAQLNPFDHSGARAYQHITFVERHEDHDAAVRAVLGQPDVGFLHVRSAVAQCFTFEVRPA